MSDKKLDIKDYVFDESYQLEQVEYDEEVDGDSFPDRDEHLKKKDELRDQYKNIKDQIARSRVRR